MKKTTIYFIFFALLVFSCQSNHDEVNIVCKKPIIVNDTLYNNTSTSNYTIKEVHIEGDCLKIKISSGGCNGNTWNAKLIELPIASIGLPLEHYLKFSLENSEICLAMITKEFSFNISSLQTYNNQAIINLSAWNQQIIYSY